MPAQAIRLIPERSSTPRPIPEDPKADDQRIRLAWRRLDRLAAAAALGVVLASPRTALLTVEILQPRDQASTTAPPRDAAARPGQGIGR
jgi:hypothetical protein